MERSAERVEEEMETEGATGPTFTDDKEMSIIDFVKEHPELYSLARTVLLTRPEKAPCEIILVKTLHALAPRSTGGSTFGAPGMGNDKRGLSGC